MEQLGIIGGGPGGADLLKTFLDVEGVRIIGIADLNPNSPGILLAKQKRIFTTTDLNDLVKVPGKKILFDATGHPQVARQLASIADETTIVVSPEVAKLIWEMVDRKAEVNRHLIHESDSLLSFIERGLTHIETLNSEHGQALQSAVEQIKQLAQLTSESQALVQQTAQIMGIIKNVADQTRILGINASIESARAGEHGRGFGVVADAIHQLSASTLKSVNSVSETMGHINKVLQDIASSVTEVVSEVQEIEANQVNLTQELHSSLEEMVRSAERLAKLAGTEA
ncbi:MAG: hypothetical protein GX971_06615 [Firmicutes bacterium]|nr:hypothetical protein [Bacillota bacterium]